MGPWQTQKCPSVFRRDILFCFVSINLPRKYRSSNDPACPSAIAQAGVLLHESNRSPVGCSGPLRSGLALPRCTFRTCLCRKESLFQGENECLKCTLVFGVMLLLPWLNLLEFLVKTSSFFAWIHTRLRQNNRLLPWKYGLSCHGAYMFVQMNTVSVNTSKIRFHDNLLWIFSFASEILPQSRTVQTNTTQRSSWQTKNHNPFRVVV